MERLRHSGWLGGAGPAGLAGVACCTAGGCELTRSRSDTRKPECGLRGARSTSGRGGTALPGGTARLPAQRRHVEPDSAVLSHAAPADRRLLLCALRALQRFRAVHKGLRVRPRWLALARVYLQTRRRRYRQGGRGVPPATCRTSPTRRGYLYDRMGFAGIPTLEKWGMDHNALRRFQGGGAGLSGAGDASTRIPRRGPA